MARNATAADHGATTRQSCTHSQRWPLASHTKIGSSISAAPAGAGTPVRKPADLCGCSSASICELKRARRSAMQTE